MDKLDHEGTVVQSQLETLKLDVRCYVELTSAGNIGIDHVALLCLPV